VSLELAVLDSTRKFGNLLDCNYSKRVGQWQGTRYVTVSLRRIFVMKRGSSQLPSVTAAAHDSLPSDSCKSLPECNRRTVKFMSFVHCLITLSNGSLA